MNTPTPVDTLNPLETLQQSTVSSAPSDKQPAIRVLAGPLRLAYHQSFPILLDASDPLVQESKMQDDHTVTLVSAQPPQQGSTRANGMLAWTNRIKGRLSAFAVRAVAGLRRVLDRG